MATKDPIRNDGLPSYGDVATSDAAATQTLQPITLFAAGRFIHSSDPQEPPLYELSHSVGFLSDTDRKVVLDRLEHTVRSVGGVPSVTTRQRSLFHLTHRTPAESPAFAFQAESKSRRAAATGSMGIEKVSRFGRKSSFRVCRAFFRGTGRYEPGPVMFSAAPPTSKGQGVVWEWSDGEGNLLAREVQTPGGPMSFVVTAEMTPGMRDALVAAWLMRVWWGLAAGV